MTDTDKNNTHDVTSRDVMKASWNNDTNKINTQYVTSRDVTKFSTDNNKTFKYEVIFLGKLLI